MTRKVKPVRAEKVLPELSARRPSTRRRKHVQVLVEVRNIEHKRVEVIDVGLVFENGPAVTERHLKALDTTIEALREQALANLKAVSSPEHWSNPNGTQLLVYNAPDNYAAERLLILPDLIDPWPFGGVFAATPAVGALVVLPTPNLASLEELQTLAHIAQVRAAEPDGITSQLYWHDGKTCHPVFTSDSEEATTLVPPAEFARRLKHMTALAVANAATVAEA